MTGPCRTARSGRRKSAATVEDSFTGGEGSSSWDESDDGTASRERLKARFVAELRERRRHQQTALQLQRNYDDLLRSHAEKELAIEQLRLGARLSLTVDPPAPSRALAGTVPATQRVFAFSLPQAAGRASIASLATAAPKSAALTTSSNNSQFSLFFLQRVHLYSPDLVENYNEENKKRIKNKDTNYTNRNLQNTLAIFNLKFT